MILINFKYISFSDRKYRNMQYCERTRDLKKDINLNTYLSLDRIILSICSKDFTTSFIGYHDTVKHNVT